MPLSQKLLVQGEACLEWPRCDQRLVYSLGGPVSSPAWIGGKVALGRNSQDDPQPLADKRASLQHAGQAEPASSGAWALPQAARAVTRPRPPGAASSRASPVLTRVVTAGGGGRSVARAAPRGGGSGGRAWAPISPCAPLPSVRFVPFLGSVSPGSPRSEPGGGLGDPDTVTECLPGAPVYVSVALFFGTGQVVKPGKVTVTLKRQSLVPHTGGRPVGEKEHTHLGKNGLDKSAN